MQGSLRGNKGPRIRHVADESAPYETITIDKLTPVRIPVDRGMLVTLVFAMQAAGLIVGPLLGFSVRLAVMRRPLIVIGDDGFTDGRSGRMIPWDAVEEIYANTHQGAYGLDHWLRLVLKRRAGQPAKRRFITTNATNEDEIEVSLDGLAQPREEVIKAVERRFGRPVLRTTDAGLQNLRRRTR